MPDKKKPSDEDAPSHEFQRVRNSLKPTTKRVHNSGNKTSKKKENIEDAVKSMLGKLMSGVKKVRKSWRKSVAKSSTKSSVSSKQSIRLSAPDIVAKPKPQPALSKRASTPSAGMLSANNISNSILTNTSAMASEVLKLISKNLIDFDMSMFPNLIRSVIRQIEKKIEDLTKLVKSNLETVTTKEDEDSISRIKIADLPIKLSLANLKLEFSVPYNDKFKDYFNKAGLSDVLQRHLSSYFNAFMDMTLNLFIVENTTSVERSEIITDDRGGAQSRVTSVVTQAPIVHKQKFIEEFTLQHADLIRTLMNREAEYIIGQLTNNVDLSNYTQKPSKQLAAKLLADRMAGVRDTLDARGSMQHFGASKLPEHLSAPVSESAIVKVPPTSVISNPAIVKVPSKSAVRESEQARLRPDPKIVIDEPEQKLPRPVSRVKSVKETTTHTRELPKPSEQYSAEKHTSFSAGLGTGGFAGPAKEDLFVEIQGLKLPYSVESKIKSHIQHDTFMDFLKARLEYYANTLSDYSTEEKEYQLQIMLNHYIRYATDYLYANLDNPNKEELIHGMVAYISRSRFSGPNHKA